MKEKLKNGKVCIIKICIIEKLYLTLYQQTITNIKAMKTKLNSNQDFQNWYSNQEDKYGSVWSVHSFGVTNVPIDYPCIVLGRYSKYDAIL